MTEVIDVGTRNAEVGKKEYLEVGTRKDGIARAAQALAPRVALSV